MVPMDLEQRQAAAAAVREAMDAQGLEAPQLAALADISVETVRDFLACRRWPRTAKRNAIERQLGWDAGRIAAIARATERSMGNRDPVQAALDQTELDPDERYEVLSFYLEVLNRRRARSTVAD